MEVHFMKESTRKIEYTQEMMDSDEFLNIYGSLGHHHDVTIAGTTESLIKLRDLIDKALEYNQVSGVYWPHDREGYDLIIYKVDDPTEWDQLCYPYPLEKDKRGYLCYYGETFELKHPANLFDENVERE